MAVLYVVATPIGNLRDITLRALDVLKTVDLIVCEDTRHSLRLLNTYEIHKPLISCHGYNEARASVRVVEELKAGKDLAYVSDAGSPGISDPGSILVASVIDAGFQVIPLPGPSALTSLYSVAGLSGKRLCFEGFLSPKSGRRKTQVRELLASGDLCVVYESPFRILALLNDIGEIDPGASLVVGRELTKIHEEILRGSPLDVSATLGARDSVKGEFVVLIQPTHYKKASTDESD